MEFLNLMWSKSAVISDLSWPSGLCNPHLWLGPLKVDPSKVRVEVSEPPQGQLLGCGSFPSVELDGRAFEVLGRLKLSSSGRRPA